MLSDKEMKLAACEKARETSEGLVKNLLEKVCVNFTSIMSRKFQLCCLTIWTVLRKKICYKITHLNYFSNLTEEARTQYSFKLQGNSLTSLLVRFRGTVDGVSSG